MQQKQQKRKEFRKEIPRFSLRFIIRALFFLSLRGFVRTFALVIRGRDRSTETFFENLCQKLLHLLHLLH